jgi:hypothetical protein
MHRQQEA